MQPTLAPQTLSTNDGANLAVYQWPANEAARAQMIICHGMAEHGARYAALAEVLNANTTLLELKCATRPKSVCFCVSNR